MAKTCLVTISDPEFSIGTEVLLYSFHKYNPEYGGDVVVICEDLPDDHRSRLQCVSPIRFVEPAPELRDAARALQAIEPRLEGIYRRLFSLEAFRLAEYQRVVYVDSDIYCAGDIADMFSAEDAFLACPDGFTYADRIDNMLVNGTPRRERYGRQPERSFNAGVLSIGQPLLDGQTYVDLLDWLRPERWKEVGSGKFTDQMLLNRHFDGQFAELPARFNYMVFLETYQRLCEPVSFLDASLVHFAGTLKPWFEYDSDTLARRAPQFLKFFDAWRELLEEARGPAESGVIEERFRRQQEWIQDYNENPFQPTGRLY